MGLLDGVVAFGGLTAQELRALEAASRIVTVQDADEIFAQGDMADAVYAIVGGEGRVRIGAVDRRSKSLMVEIFRAGDIFGEIGVLDGSVRTATAFAEGHVRLARINGSMFNEVLARCPRLGINLCRMMAARLRRTYALFQDATFESVEVRLARQLLYLAALDSRATEQGLRLAGRFRQADLADLLGTTSRSVITILNEWRAAGIVSYDAHAATVTIRSKAALMELVDSGA